MNFISKLIGLFHGHSSKQPLPDVIRKIAQSDYGTVTTSDQMLADYSECYRQCEFIRQTQGADAYVKYLRVLGDLLSLIESKIKLEARREAETAARERLDAAAAQQATLN